MDLKSILIIILVSAMFLSSILYILMKIVIRKSQNSGNEEIYETYDKSSPSLKKKIRDGSNLLFQDAYSAYIKVPLLKSYILRIRKRIQAIHSYDEMTMRRETMRIAFYTLGILSFAVLILLFMNQDITFIFMLFLGAVVVNGMLIDTFVSRVDDRLLVQLRDLIDDVRDQYQDHNMVNDAIHNVSLADKTSYEAALHAKKIHEILEAPKPKESLTAYFEMAPNRFLKVFAGLSFLVKEFGDKVLKDGASLYLTNLNKLTGEINLEILKRSRLNYLLKGLTIIAVTPILSAKPIEMWARERFPAMDDFYTSKIGFITKIVIFAVILLSYILLKKIQDQNEGNYTAKTKKWFWEEAVLKIPFIAWLVDRLVPAKRTATHYRVDKLLKDANAGFTIDWHYLHRLILGVFCSLTLITSFTVMHSLAINNVLEAPTKNATMFGQLSGAELQAAQSTTDFDRKIIEQLKGVNKEYLQNQIATILLQDESIVYNDTLLNSTTQRIIGKIDKLESEYIKWWEILVSLVVGWIGFQFPYVLLLFQKRLRQMEMQNEVDQFHTVIAMLSELDRVSVELILEWMEQFAIIFKEPLHKCGGNFSSGADQALTQLTQDAPFEPLVKIVKKLQISVDRVPIRQAFDDLETERNFYHEKRKQNNEKTIDSKNGWGRMIGFAPMYAIIFLYLVFPFVYVSIQSLGTYYSQINRL